MKNKVQATKQHEKQDVIVRCSKATNNKGRLKKNEAQLREEQGTNS
jgi:hypothetical protein